MPTIPVTNRKLRDFAYLEKITQKGLSKKQWAAMAGSALGEKGATKVFETFDAHADLSAKAKFTLSQELAGRLGHEQQARIIYVFDLAKEAFGDVKLATKFMKSKHPKLNATPLEKIDTEWGGREVERILNSMIYGLPA
jgi:uncharacterized protein (DUF2384 family)